jgi:peptide/nickel transport system ATP-binding protein
LLAAVPVPDPTIERAHIRLEGSVPSPVDPPSGCYFHTRCPRRDMAPDGGKICEVEAPPMQYANERHRILCHIPLEALSALDSVIHTPAEG